ncbi:hypothetical protein [Sodalis-like endosymbiont of Proechinophthirus fluctus]|uniref:hypothetical protein n=1 Tax=Sodalis-like endosymbiont of Proechinophthirus fluctus TaxID=1462730 RepID=UPI000AC0098D|nr:hypothetical protein [Sodalis-like endosymbiont of Proechinophthirus fluctus]
MNIIEHTLHYLIRAFDNLRKVPVTAGYRLRIGDFMCFIYHGNDPITDLDIKIVVNTI